MIRLRPAAERGHADHGWLDTWHTFSFADYFDPKHMGFRALRVVNDDRIAAGTGFGEHGHRDMEILTFVLAGALQHRDSMGNGSVIRPGDVQRMSAGTGVRHSEFNASRSEPVHLLQVWIVPAQAGLQPSYEQRTFPDAERTDRLCPAAAPDAADGALAIHQDARVYVTSLTPGASVQHDLRPGRHAWIQVATGSVELNGQALGAGDGAAVSDEPRVRLTAKEAAQVLLFDLA